MSALMTRTKSSKSEGASAVVRTLRSLFEPVSLVAMIDTENLRTASLYINNQLLSRGLLRDGQTIDFANAGKGSDDSTATAGRIIGIVNDLILRRDRDAEHRESLSAAMRNLRAENLKHTSDIARLTEKNTEEKRKADIAAASEAALKTQLKSADANARGLKEDIARMKALVSQTRTTCATEVRRRDRQIDTLKKQLGEAGRSRGSRTNPVVTTINVTADIGHEKDSPTRSGSVVTDDYDLRSETNAFLAKLAQNLSEENETILNVMQRAMGQLRQMSGYQGEERGDAQVAKRPSCEDLAAELDAVMDHMRIILTNPSFVPIEEVMVREEEINRLKTGWVKMETRWKEAVHLMDGWRKRMASSGRQVCDEELRMGLRLSPVRVNDVEETRQAFGLGLTAVAEEAEDDVEPSLRSPCPPSQVSVDLVPELDYGDQDEQAHGETDGDSTGYENNVPAGNYEFEEANVELQGAPQLAPDSSPLPEPPQLSPLRNSASAGNRGSHRNGRARPRPGEFSAIVEENTRDLAAESKSMRSLPVRPKAMAAQARLPKTSLERPRSPSRSSLDDVLLPEPESTGQSETHESEAFKQEPEEAQQSESGPAAHVHNTPCRVTSRPSLPRTTNLAPQQSPLTMSTIAAKLAASEREADAARVRAKLRAVRGGVKGPPMARTASGDETPAAALEQDRPVEDVDPVKHDPAPQDEEQPKPEKRKRDRKPSKAASRRRSTLSPLELQTLISGNAQ
ncbi:Ribosomal RNA-processing protein 7 [Tolypocladium paradoxum]|uniref:Ribosomal RNA-processing protein 7 n=1 Tax=Tolypocladium paradoxum TaxID=94208 RepID=A0A2S4KR76_9HYPO|nr:Ribosomal RNA-processing protein 7 [Tolypocladium paradoxum]